MKSQFKQQLNLGSKQNYLLQSVASSSCLNKAKKCDQYLLEIIFIWTPQKWGGYYLPLKENLL